jgi:hypothetical protein
VMAGRHAEPGHGAADHAGADETDSCHDRANPGADPVIPVATQ